MLSGWLITLDKQPGVRPVGVRETWRRLMAKFLLHVTGQDSKAAYGIDQIYSSVEDGI